MKGFTIGLACILFAAASAFAQADEDHEQSIKKKAVPKAVIAAFEKSYPKATVKAYSKEIEDGTTEYEIESQEGKITRDVSYAEDGTVLAIEESVSYADLPEAVRTAITKDHAKASVATCERVMKGATTNYEVVLKQGKKKTEVVFDASGAVVTTESKDKD